METVTLSNGNKINYRIFNGTYYHEETPDNLIRVLDYCRQNNIRVTVDYGDTKTKKSWNETYDITGYIGRSTGKIKIPLLVYNSRSFGGSSLLDNCILSIKYANKKQGGLLYKI